MAQWKETLEPYIKVHEEIKTTTLNPTAGEDLIIGVALISDAGPATPTLITSQSDFIKTYASQDITKDYIESLNELYLGADKTTAATMWSNAYRLAGSNTMLVVRASKANDIYFTKPLNTNPNDLNVYVLRDGQYDKALEYSRNDYSKTKAYLMKGDNEEAFKNLVVYVKRGTLYIETKKAFMRGMFSNGMEGITVYVTTPTINKIAMAGSGQFTTESPISGKDLKVALAGSGDVVFKKLLTCDNMHVELAGSGNVTVKQLKADRLHTNIAGSGNAEYQNLDVASVKSNIAGSGNVILQGKVGNHKEGIASSGSVDISGIVTE